MAKVRNNYLFLLTPRSVIRIPTIRVVVLFTEDKTWEPFIATTSLFNINIDFEDNCRVESSTDVEIYWNCGKLMDCINFHLRVRMTSRQYSFFAVSNSSSDVPSGGEILINFSQECVEGIRHFSEW